MSTEIQETAGHPALEQHADAPRWFPWKTGILLLLAVSAIPIVRGVVHKTEAVAPPAGLVPVAVVKVDREDLAKELEVQAEFRPYQEVDLHSKVAGFLEKISVDIGDRVEAGQALATLEIPELRDDLKRAQAVEQHGAEEVKRAEAGYEETRAAYQRLSAVNKVQPGLVAQQDLDVAHAKDRQAQSSLAAAAQQVEVARAEISKLKTMALYSQITAPFRGVVTKRYADPGALIQAGISSSTQAMPLVRLSQLDQLRLVFPVSMSYVSLIDVGTPVEVRVQNRGKPLSGKVARTTRKIETATRTMDVEVDVPNNDLKLLPGMYASAVLTLEHREHTLAVPIQAVARGQSPSVLRVTAGHKLEEQKVKLGLETPDKVEILAGLKDGDLVVIGSRAQFKPGQKIEPRLIEAEKN